MTNISITTSPTGRSPDKKYFFGEQTKDLDLTRPKFNKIGKQEDFDEFYQTFRNKAIAYPEIKMI